MGLLGPVGGDLSGTVIGANKRIQVIAGHPCRFVPDESGACDRAPTTISAGQVVELGQVTTDYGEQYRVKYIFLAPHDYDLNYVSVIQPMDATVTIDGAPTGVAPQSIGSGHGVARVQLGPGANGAHVLEASAPVGIQVMGYGSYTSYYYPGGLDLKAISPPPPIE